MPPPAIQPPAPNQQQIRLSKGLSRAYLGLLLGRVWMAGGSIGLQNEGQAAYRRGTGAAAGWCLRRPRDCCLPISCHLCELLHNPRGMFFKGSQHGSGYLL